MQPSGMSASSPASSRGSCTWKSLERHGNCAFRSRFKELHLAPRSVCTRGCSRDRNAAANLRPPMEFMMQAVRRYRKILFKIIESASRVFAGPRFLNSYGLVSQINSNQGGGGEHGGSLKGWRMELFVLWWRYNCP